LDLDVLMRSSRLMVSAASAILPVLRRIQTNRNLCNAIQATSVWEITHFQEMLVSVAGEPEVFTAEGRGLTAAE
jgi:hypothetical protein